MNKDGVPVAIATDRSRRARARVGRRLVPLVLASVALCVVVVWQRDARHIDSALARIRSHVESLQRYLVEHGTLPGTLPSGDAGRATQAPFELRYASTPVIEWARTADRPVLIGYGRVNGLIARPNGHAVIYYDHGALRADWMTGRALGTIWAQQEALAAAARARSGR